MVCSIHATRRCKSAYCASGSATQDYACPAPASLSASLLARTRRCASLYRGRSNSDRGPPRRVLGRCCFLLGDLGLMRVTLFGTRGSLATPGVETSRYGGNTSSVEVRGGDGTILALDAGTGIRQLGCQIPPETSRIDVLLTHLHMDHIQGLGFFGPLYNPKVEVHVWGPATST